MMNQQTGASDFQTTADGACRSMALKSPKNWSRNTFDTSYHQWPSDKAFHDKWAGNLAVGFLSFPGRVDSEVDSDFLGWDRWDSSFGSNTVKSKRQPSNKQVARRIRRLLGRNAPPQPWILQKSRNSAKMNLTGCRWLCIPFLGARKVERNLW